MRVLVLAAALGAAAVFAPPAAAEIDVAGVVRKVQARYDSTADFTADVEQQITVASMNKVITSRGTVAFKKPGKMLWEFTEDERQVIVADGTTLWFYRPEERQVLKAPFDAAFRSTTPISFLTGVGDIDEDFVISADGESEDGSLLHLRLVPRRDGGSVGELRLTVERETSDIRGAQIRDPFGNVSTLRFERMRRNVGLTDARFEFAVPAGVDVIPVPATQ
jgi:outer membrane lipoprotein carrier protein